MPVPSRENAVRTLVDLGAPTWLLRHSGAVAEIGTFLAERIRARGTPVDVALVEAAGLLHDLDKALPAGHEVLQLGHGAAGAEWLRRHGQGEIAAAVAGHPATLLSDDQRYRQWRRAASLEERIVAYADKRAEQDVVSLDDRFAAWRERHPDHAESLALGLQRARRLEQELCAAAGITPAQVSRAAWFADLAAVRSGEA
jgi:putative nucleotidyltransferase with HDIG domain